MNKSISEKIKYLKINRAVAYNESIYYVVGKPYLLLNSYLVKIKNDKTTIDVQVKDLLILNLFVCAN